MANVIDIILRAKDSTAGAWKSASAAAKKLGRRIKSAMGGAARFAKSAARAIAAVATATAAAAAVVINAYRKQETAENDLTAALQAHGDAADDLVPKLKAVAAAIQDETGRADENTLALMAQIRNLGVQGDALGQAAKNAIGLAKALKLDSNAAARYTALAMKGEYTILQRYVPALRTATTEQEKHAIVTDLMRKGYQQAQSELNTVAGRFTELKGRIGDMLEKLGNAIVEGGNFRDTMAEWSEKIKEFQNSEAFKGIADKIKTLLEDAREFTSIIAKGGKGRSEAIGALAKVLRLSIAVGAEKAATILKKAAKNVGELIGKSFVRVASKHFGEKAGGQRAVLPAGIRRQAEAAGLTSDIVAESEKLTDNETKLVKAASELADLLERQRDAIGGESGSVGSTGDLADATEKVADEAFRLLNAHVLTTAQYEKQLALVNQLKGVQKQLADMAIQGQIGGLQGAAAGRQKNIDAIGKQIANIQNRRQNEAIARQEKADHRREKELTARVRRRGQTLSKRDADWLKVRLLTRQQAREQKAKDIADAAADKIKKDAAEQNRKDRLKALQDIARDLKQNIQAG